MRIRTFLLLLGVPLLLMGALILGLRVGKDELEQSVTGDRGRGGGGATTDGGQAAARGVRLQRIGTFRDPLYVTAPPGDRRRVFVVEQSGRIYVLVGGKRVRRPFLDVSGEIVAGGEQGLLSMAFAPDYRRSGRFYVDYTDRNGDTRVVEYRRSGRSPNVASRSTRRVVLGVDQPYPNHNGGLVLFGPDGYLYIGMGDGGSAGDPENRAQNLNSLLGKLLRIDPRRHGSAAYRSPASNPFVGRGGRNEIYAYGLRNPWRFWFHRRNGDLYIGDVGQGAVEEIDYAPRGAARGRNYGWSCFEGNRPYDKSRNCPGATAPILTYGRAGGECSVTGGVVVRDPQLPALAGRYVYGDFCTGQIRNLRVTNGRATGDRAQNLHVANLSSFGEDARGRVYATSLSGAVYRLRSK
jgi:glucose/arabinose dehydrogenase